MRYEWYNILYYSEWQRSVYQMDNTKKNIVLRIEPAFHQQVKLYVTMNNTTLQEYIVGLIKKDMEQNKKKVSI